MQYTTLEALEFNLTKKEKKRSFRNIFNEIKIFLLIFMMIFSATYFITNAQLLKDSVNDSLEEPMKVQKMIDTMEIESRKEKVFEHEHQKKDLKSLIEQYEGVVFQEKEPATDMNQYLRANLDQYSFNFNSLPPTNRLMIASINLDIPLIETRAKSDGTYAEELENGVVKYPGSFDPGEGGTTLFFGHTSQEYRENNPYGTVFRNIPNLQPGNRIKVIREGKMYQYEVKETRIVSPKEVNKQYLEFAESEKEYIILMGCYPIGRTDKRMLVIAQRI